MRGWYTAPSMRSPALSWLLLLSVAARAQTPLEPHTYAIPMRDGIHLSTDVYGAEPGVRKPVLLMRTPYDKRRPKATAERYATAGYVAIVQDARGAYASEGKYLHYNNDDQDGFDTIDWIVQQPWSNGKVGMWGTSHPGEVQWVAAATRHPGLVVIAPVAAASSLYRILYQGGSLLLALIASGAGLAVNPPPPGIAVPKDFTAIHYHLPLSTLDEAIGWPQPWLTSQILHNRPDGYWQRLEAKSQLETLEVASQNIVGYYDLSCSEVVDDFLRLPNHGKKQLILGPWDHSTIGKQVVAGVDFGPEANLNVEGENLQWFDRFLKPAEDVKPFPLVRYFLMGDNVWRTADKWPPADTITTAFYLHSAGKAKMRTGDGKLTRQSPTGPEAADAFESDPDRPVPSEAEDAPQPSRGTPWRPVDRSTIEDRPDVLVYTAAMQSTPLSIAGQILADLWVSVDAPDADWAVNLVDVAPDGVTRGLAEGILRSSGRDSAIYPALLDPGHRVRLTVDLGHAAMTILPGHALRIEIAGSSFPMFDRNLHTGEGPTGMRKRVASQTVYHDRNLASRLWLSVFEPRRIH
jgi:putative CocE/NonD family hydrolase